MDPGEVKPLVSRVNPAGVSTPARPGTVAAVGNTLQGTGEAVLGLVGEPLLPRVERCGCWVVGRPELTTASSKAAAGARATAEMALEGMAGSTRGCFGFTGAR